MAKGTTKASLRGPEGPVRKFTLTTWIMIGLILPAGYMTFKHFSRWSVANAASKKLTSDIQVKKQKNVVLAPAYDILQNRRFQMCNKSPWPLMISWLSATYHDGKGLRVFDSSRCKAWQGLEVASGENKNLFLSSGQEGCNWAGPVIYYAIRFTKETDEASIPYNMVGRYAGFDRDCFTVP